MIIIKDLKRALSKFYVGILLLIIVLFSFFRLQAQFDSIAVDEGFRYFLLHLPETYSIENSYALVIGLHGGLGSSTQFERQSQLSVKAEEEGFIVVYPDGAGGKLGFQTWNAGVCCGYAVDNQIDDVGFIDALIDSLIVRFPIDTSRIYATGMSNGGFMSYRLACELSGRIAAIAPVACSMSVECMPDYPVPVIHFHSYLDESIPLQGGVGMGITDNYNPPLDSVVQVWQEFNGCKSGRDTLMESEEYIHIAAENCDCEADIELYLTYDGGHSWPGGRRGTIFGDPPSKSIDANDLMWEFFMEHPLCRDETTTIAPQIRKNDLLVYPNPAKEYLFVEGSSSNTDFIIVDVNGVQYYPGYTNQSGNLKRFEVISLPKGMYFVVSKEKGNQVARFVKM